MNWCKGILANAVARIDNLDFLADVIPKTTTYRQFKDKRKREEASAAAAAAEAEEADDTPDAQNTTSAAPTLPPGQTTLSNGFGSMKLIGRHAESGVDPAGVEGNGVLRAEELSMPVNGSPIAVRTVHSLAHDHAPQGSEDDVEMADEAGTWDDDLDWVDCWMDGSFHSFLAYLIDWSWSKKSIELAFYVSINSTDMDWYQLVRAKHLDKDRRRCW
jgi:hypothetical protein